MLLLGKSWKISIISCNILLIKILIDKLCRIIIFFVIKEKNIIYISILYSKYLTGNMMLTPLLNLTQYVSVVKYTLTFSLCQKRERKRKRNKETKKAKKREYPDCKIQM